MSGYDANELEELRQFLRQGNNLARINYGTSFPLSASDTTDWNTNADWVTKLTNAQKTKWNTSNPKRLTYLGINAI